MAENTARLNFITVDVFTKTRFAGNPLAIVELPSDVTLSQEAKQKIAKEFNLSETVILHEALQESSKWERRIDIFTPYSELPFAGHPTIGTACHIFNDIVARAGKPSGTSRLEGTIITKAGTIAVEYDPLHQKASAAIPHNIHVHEKNFTKSQLLSLRPNITSTVSTDIGVLPEESPVVSIVTGMTFILARLQDLSALKALSPGPVSIEAELDKEWAETFLGILFYVDVSSATDNTRRLRTRMISNLLEDPATGSASCALASYLSLNDGAKKKIFAYEMTQGVEMGRQSHLEVTVTVNEEGGVAGVKLSGSACRMLEGTIAIE